MAKEERDFSAFMKGSTTAFPKKSTKIAQSVPSVTDAVTELEGDTVVVDLTEDPVTVAAEKVAKPKPAARATKKKAQVEATEALVRTSLSLPFDLAERLSARADSDGVWKTDVVLDAVDAHLGSVAPAPSRRRRRRGNQNASLSVSFEPSLMESLQEAGGEHGSMSWVVAQCLDRYLG